MRCQNSMVYFLKKITQLQQKCTEDQHSELIETNEQALADTRFKYREFVPTIPKRLISLRRRMDLKNRTLVSQLRNMMALRRFINEIKDKYHSTHEQYKRHWLGKKNIISKKNVNTVLINFSTMTDY